MKKFISILLALVMALSLVSVTAFAADGDPVITAPDNGHTYEVFQIFTGDLADGVLSNVVLGQNGVLPTDTTLAKALAALEAIDSTASDTDKLAVINQYANLNSEPIETLDKNNPSVSVAPGYYLIKDKDKTVPDGEAYTTYIVKVVGNVDISPKGDVPTVDKNIVEDNNALVKANEASIGESVTYKLTGTLPSNLAEYEEYFYQFNDTMSKGLTYNQNSITVTIGNVDVTQYFYKNVSPYDATNGTSIKVTIADVKALDQLANVSITPNTVIVVTYTATVNENAVIAGEGNPNDVFLKFSNDPNHSGDGTPPTPPTPPTEEPTPKYPTGDTPEKEVKTYVTELTILKVDQDGNVLTGAEFTLTGPISKVIVTTATTYTVDENGTYWKLIDGTYTTDDPATEGMDTSKYASTTIKYTKSVTTETQTADESTDVKAFVGEDGTLTFTGLGAGNYILTESVTPAGYNTIAPITFTVSFNATTGKFGATGPINVESDNTLFVEIENQAGTVLPETGGMGTTLFYVIGGILVAAAAVVFITRKRVGAED